MRSSLLLIGAVSVSLSSAALAAATPWTDIGALPAGSNACSGMTFVDRLHGFAKSTADDGSFHIHRTTDGMTWTSHRVGAPPIDGIEPQFGGDALLFVDDKIGFFGGSSRTDKLLLKSTDAGQTWSARAVKATAAVKGLSVLTIAFAPGQKLVGLAGGTISAGKADEALLARTDDGGETWTALVLPWGEKGELQAATMIDARTWIVSGNTGMDGWVYRTSDAGQAWKKVHDRTFEQLQFVDARNGFGLDPQHARPAVGGVWATTDGGETWVNRKPMNGGSVMAFIDPWNGLAAGQQDFFGLKRTKDGGKTWTAENVPGNYNPSTMYCLAWPGPDAYAGSPRDGVPDHFVKHATLDLGMPSAPDAGASPDAGPAIDGRPSESDGRAPQPTVDGGALPADSATTTGPVVDARPAPATDAGSTSPSPTKGSSAGKGGGCSAAPGRTSSSGWGLALAGLVAAFTARRRRTR